MPCHVLVLFQWLHSLSHHKNPFLPTHAVPSPFPGNGTPDVTRARTALAPAPAQGCAGVGALDFSHLASTPSDDSTPRITFEDDRSTGTPKDDVSRSRTVTASAGVLNSARDNDYIQRQCAQGRSEASAHRLEGDAGHGGVRTCALFRCMYIMNWRTSLQIGFP